MILEIKPERMSYLFFHVKPQQTAGAMPASPTFYSLGVRRYSLSMYLAPYSSTASPSVLLNESTVGINHVMSVVAGLVEASGRFQIVGWLPELQDFSSRHNSHLRSSPALKVIT